MAFSTELKEHREGKVIYLKDRQSDCIAEIYSLGALLNSFIVKAKNRYLNIIDGFESIKQATLESTNGFKSAKLSPFVCRLHKGSFEFENKAYTIEKFYLGDEAIHGLIYDAPFEIVRLSADENAAEVTLLYLYNNKKQGFPFNYSMEVTYRLSGNCSLTLITKVINEDNKNMPLCDGWHPYFKLNSKVDELMVQFNSNALLEFDNRLLPTGKSLPDNRFEKPVLLGNTFLDNSFIVKNFDEPACILTNAAEGLQLSITPGENYPILQVYTPPHRNSIAVENLSSPPDAFNNGMNLISLQPGESKIFNTTYQIKTL